MEINNIITSKRIIILLTAVFFLIIIYYAFTLYNESNKIPHEIASINIYDSYDLPEALIYTPNNEIIVLPSFYITNFHKEVQTYRYTLMDRIDDEVVTEFIKDFNMVETYRNDNSGVGTVISANTEDNTEDITAYLDLKRIKYTNYKPGLTSQNLSGIDLEEFVSAGDNLIKNLDLNSSGLFKLNNYSYLTIKANSETIKATYPSEAQILELTYIAEIDEIPIYDVNGNLVPNTITIWLNRDKELVTLIYEPTSKIEGTLGTVNIKPQSVVEKELELGLGIMTDTSVPSPVKITRTLVQSANLGYLSSNNVLIPIYIAKGKSNTFEEQNAGDSVIMLNAVKLNEE